MKKSAWLLPLTTLATAALMIGLILAGFLIIQINIALPDAQSIKSVELKVPLRVFSAEGLLISEFGEERRKPVPIENIPRSLINAVLASEDDNFFGHRGIDITGLVRAAVSNFRSGASQQGASTITMQVARNFFLSPEKTYTRKLKEVLLAIKLEQILSKDEILSLYLNKIYLGHRAYGFGAAADVYYGRELADLTLAETAMLAGLPKAPSSINPLRNPQRAVDRRNYVLGRLRDLDHISEEEFKEAAAAPITAQKHNIITELSAPHIAEMVRAQLTEEFGEEAYWSGLNVYTTILARQQQAAEKALRAGLQAYDRRHGFRGPVGRIDPDKLENKDAAVTPAEHYAQLLSSFPNSQEQVAALITASGETQAVAQTRNYGSVSLELKDSLWARRYQTANNVGDRPESMTQLLSVGDVVYIQPLTKSVGSSVDDQPVDAEEPINWRLSQLPNISGALISMEPGSGRILSLVGGYDFFLSKYNRAIQSIRQPGSNIKPFIYSAALDKDFTPATLISGAPIVIRDPIHGIVWRPENYSGKFFGPTRMREALSKSLNLVSVRLLRSIGIPYAREYLERFGLDMSRFSPTLTLALGAGGATPLEMLRAYSVLANTGYRIEPYFVDHITDRTGNLIYRAQLPELCDPCYQQYLPQEQILDETLEAFDDENATPLEIEPVDHDQETDQQAEIDEEPEVETYQAPRVMNLANNFLTVSMLKDVVRRGTARKALALNRQDLAGKTGTTNDYVDAWFTGFNSKVATTVWTGFDDPATMGRGEAGSVTALPIWVDYMRVALAGVAQDTDTLPDFIEEGLVNSVTGERTDEYDPDAITEYFTIKELLPDHRPPVLTEIDIESLRQIRFLNIDNTEPAVTDVPQKTPPEPRIIEHDKDTEGLF